MNIEPIGLTPFEMGSILAQRIAANGRSMTPTELANETGYEPADVKAALDCMVGLECLTKRDGRYGGTF